MLTSQIAVYRTTPTHTRFTRWECVHKKLLFGADFGPAGGVIGPYFFKNDVGEAITVKGEVQIDDNQFLLALIGRYKRGRYVVPAGQRYVPHSESH